VRCKLKIRDDDKPEVVEKRYSQYVETMREIFKRQSVFVVDGEMELDKIVSDVKFIVENHCEES